MNKTETQINSTRDRDIDMDFAYHLATSGFNLENPTDFIRSSNGDIMAIASLKQGYINGTHRTPEQVVVNTADWLNIEIDYDLIAIPRVCTGKVNQALEKLSPNTYTKKAILSALADQGVPWVFLLKDVVHTIKPLGILNGM